VFSQTSNYIPFPVEYGQWKYENALGGPSAYGPLLFHVTGDTTIDNTIYKKLHQFEGWGQYVGYAGAYRELDKIVYYVPISSSTEHVLYNFNLNVGDTIFNPYNGECEIDTAIVETIDSVLYDNNYRKQFILIGTSGYLVGHWVEGIGSKFGLGLIMPYLNMNCQVYYLLCMFNDNTNSGIGTCFVSVEEHTIPDRDLSIYPNPSTSGFTIKLENSVIKEIWIMDSSGRTIVNEVDLNQNELKIDNLPSGLYILKVFDDNGNVSVKKLISSP
jgi:hypothetical protein